MSGRGTSPRKDLSMINKLKQKIIENGAKLMQSDAVEKLMESEQFGVVMEKAMAVPFKVTNALMAGKERLVTVLDLATQEDIDEIKRAMARMESVLKDTEEEES
jgi:hypothetical protein